VFHLCAFVAGSYTVFMYRVVQKILRPYRIINKSFYIVLNTDKQIRLFIKLRCQKAL